MTTVSRGSGAVVCVVCSAEIHTARGPRLKRVYCSNACRQRAYRKRAKPAAGPGKISPAGRALDTFVGRQEELAALHRLCRAHRLVTVFGPPGAGKTRLVTEFAASAGQLFSDGVHLVALAGTSDPAQVPRVVTAAVRAAGDDLPALLDALQGRQALLVLDNCEHLADACGDLVQQLLHHCPLVRVLVTSREVLRLPGEKVFSTGQLGDEDAVRLFADRAQSTAPDFVLDADNRESVALLCRRLDNLPLAVELSARLVRMLPPDYLLDHLDDRFGLLVAGTRSGDPKHRSLHAAIDWSYRLLDAGEQALLRRLSVLPGGFDVALATQVSADLDLPVIELIASLESKSLLVPVPGDGPRFRHWQSVRAHAHEELVAASEHEVAVERLVVALTSLALPLTECFTPARDLDARLRLEEDNFQYALDHLRDRGDVRLPLLAGALSRYRTGQGVVGESRRLLEPALRVPDAPAAFLVLALDEAAWAAAKRGDRDEALVLATRAVAGSATVSPLLRGRALNGLAYAHQELGDYRNALARFTESADLVRGVGDRHSIGLSAHNLAWAAVLADDLVVAQSALDEVLPLCEFRGRAPVWHTAGTLHLRRGDLITARKYYQAGLAEIDPTSIYIPYLVEGVGLTAIRGGRAEQGLRLLGAGERLRRLTDTVCDSWWENHVSAVRSEVGDRQPGLNVEALLEEGRKVESPAAVIDLALHRRTTESPGAITDREQEVAALVACGRTNVEIARALRISERTVESHLDHVRTKLNLRTRAHVAAWVVRNLPAAQ